MLLQEFFFCQALAELGIDQTRIEVDHPSGQCAHPEIGRFPLVFPIALVKKIQLMPKTKTVDYYFQGAIYPGREWIMKYDNVTASWYGRNPARKYQFHAEYFAKLSSTRFALCPTGACPWSYRFFEAIMCEAIPVLSDQEQDIYAPSYFFYRDSEEKHYSIDRCRENYAVFLRNHTLIHLHTSGDTEGPAPWD